MLSKVIDYRTVIKSIVHYEEVGDAPGIFKEILLFIWKTVLFENLYYEAPTEPETDTGVKLNVEGDSQTVLINQIDAILQFDYAIRGRNKGYTSSIVVGFVERYGDYYEYYSLTQECKRQIKDFENRYTRFSENFDGKYHYGDMTAYSYLSLEGILLSHAMRTAHPIVYNCLFSLKNEVFKGSLEYISQL